MCVIAAKPAGIDMPTHVELENMWGRNPDGAGLMYAAKGMVHIEKGFMEFESLIDRLDQLSKTFDLKKLAVVMHFRITTHGGTKPENCHPFPISDSVGMLKKLVQKTRVGVAHNGIIPVTPRDKSISDTMEYIAGQLAPLSKEVPDFYKNKNLMQMIKHATDSKLAFLTGSGEIYTVGSFVENKGIKYSNDSYKYSWGWRSYDCSLSNELGGWKDLNAMSTFNTREVMWLNERKGEFVFDENGDFALGEFAIDSAGNVYEYDYQEDLLMLSYSYTALNGEGIVLRFDPDSDMVTKELVML